MNVESLVTTGVLLLGVFAVLRLVRPFLLRTGGSDPFLRISDEDELRGLLDEGQTEPIVLFLHDPYCPISGGAFRKLVTADTDIHLIDVSRQHELSQAVEQATGVRHESPQVLVLKHGSVVYHESHGRIRTDRLHEAIGSPGEA